METHTILSYWFGPNQQKNKMKWFDNGKLYDSEIKELFAKVHHEASHTKEIDYWTADLKSTLALIIILDQFSRHIYRNTAQAYKNDSRAVNVTKQGLKKFDIFSRLRPEEIVFFLMPLQHSLKLDDQILGVFYLSKAIDKNPQNKFLKEALEHQLGHLVTLGKFGRFPMRNQSRNIPSTINEKRYILSRKKQYQY